MLKEGWHSTWPVAMTRTSHLLHTLVPRTEKLCAAAEQKYAGRRLGDGQWIAPGKGRQEGAGRVDLGGADEEGEASV